jgi:glycosyltransferase involved in cell wall biosynthesis
MVGRMDEVDVVLPCLDEAGALPYVLGRLPDGYCAIVVDNGSTDGSPEVARGHGAKVVFERRKGYGAAVHKGILAATTPIVCVLDADGSLDPAELPRLVDRLIGADAALVVGRRIAAGGGTGSWRSAWPWHARLGNAFLAWVLRRRGVDVHDIGPVRAGYRTGLLDLGVADRAFGYPLELLLRAAAAGWRVDEVDVSYQPRIPGTKSKVTGTVRGTLRAVRDMTAAIGRVRA